jgi:glutathione S-transferase
MTIKVHGAAGSSCTRLVLMVLVEKKVPYELVSVDFTTGENKKPPFLAKQPFGKVPVLEDNGFFVYESRAIAKYIAKKYAAQGTKLYPDEKDLQEFAMFEQVSVMFVKEKKKGGGSADENE